ncbi:hypothetical protein [Sphingopyxis sp. QXT-31]|uniref:hypothetical protein n=1 Tax=Sphingopyxis sp. QXT-31 TaxID=1357916 RepID=UPI0012EBF000|nr:hypothetical protein [Sphingopyxis sp. QXT-31]
MRFLTVFAFLLLASCGGETHSSLCDLDQNFQGSEGDDVTFDAMLVRGSQHVPAMVVDKKCWKGIAVNPSNSSQEFQRAFDAPGTFNKSAKISGRIVTHQDRTWLVILETDRIEIGPAMTASEESRFVQKMIRERNEYVASRHP